MVSFVKSIVLAIMTVVFVVIFSFLDPFLYNFNNYNKLNNKIFNCLNHSGRKFYSVAFIADATESSFILFFLLSLL
jgi:hypothetical protein